MSKARGGRRLADDPAAIPNEKRNTSNSNASRNGGEIGQNSKLDAALIYASKGWPVFPLFYVLKNGACSCEWNKCQRIGKHPTTKNGLQEATTDEAKIRKWWTESPHANIALATGGDTELVVFDIDSGVDKKTGLAKVGPASWAAIEGTIPETLICSTGSGGKHFYFRSSSDIKNSQSKIAKDIDVRGSGGYVILPPSNHASGGRYEWENEFEPAPLPDFLERLCGTKSKITYTDGLDEAVKADAAKVEKFTPSQLVKLLEFIPADCERDAWWQIGAALKTELGDKGFEVWDNWSRKAADKYDHKTITGQWESFETGKMSGGTVYHYAKTLGEFRGFDVEVANVRVKAGWSYCIATQEFISPDLTQRLTKSQYSDKFAPEAPKRGTFADLCLCDPDLQRVDSFTFEPNGSLVVIEGSQTKLNLWQRGAVVPSPGDVKQFIAHAKHILPNESERKLFLQYLAFQVQRPGVKVRWAVVLQGRQRTGKSYFGRVIGKILGERNVSRPTNERLHEPWTNWQEGAQLIVIEELMGYGRQELMNKLKPMITEPTTSVRLVGGRSYSMPNRFNFLMFTNHKGALKIDREDKRYCILFSPAERRADEDYDKLWAWTEENLPAIADYFATFSLDGFRENGDAPATEARTQAIEMNRSEEAIWIEESIQNHEGLFACDLVVVDHLMKTLPENLSHRRGVTSNSIAIALEAAGAQQVGRARLPKPFGYARAWAVRKIDHWRQQTEGKRGEAYLSFLQIASGNVVPVVNLTLDDLRRVGGGQARQLEQLIKETRSM